MKSKIKVNLQRFAMQNLDVLQLKKAEIQNKMVEAIKNDDTQAFSEAFEEFTDILQEAVLAEAKGLVQAADNQILAGRGVRVLTSEERKYYEKLIEAMKSSNPKQALSNITDTMPETIIDAVFEDITETHSLLSEIKFENAGALMKYLYSTMDGRFLAHWGPLCSTITKELGAQFGYLNFEQTKLSAWVPVCKAMLDLGPAWLDRFVRTILMEAIANGLEKGIICGRGVAENAMDPDDRIYEPIGMDRDLNTYNNTTGYAQKAPIPVTQFTPEAYGDLISQIAVGPNRLYRPVTSVILIVNPVDYFKKVMPATIYRRPDGSYVNDILPFPTKIVQSAWIDEGSAIIGLPKKYFMAMGTGKDGRIEYSDEYKFLEDERTYLIKFYGTGRPIDNNCFLLLDISDLVPAYPRVNVNNWPPVVTVDGEVDAAVTNDPLNVYGVADARLASLEIGSLDLSPEFNKSVFVYTAATSNESDTITAVAKDGESLISIKNGETTVANGAAATWTEGANVVKVTVLRGVETETYTVTVTYTDEA